MLGTDDDPQAEGSAWRLVESLRWGGSGPTTCPHCGQDGRCYFLTPGGAGRRTRTGAPTARRVWKCGACRRQFSALTGTVLEGTRIDLRVWIAAAETLAAGRAPGPLSASAAARRHVWRVLRAATALSSGQPADDRT
jgi:hypothetical protein